MLMPFEWAVLTIEEAKLLMNYIEKSTSSKTIPRRYEKMQELGLLEIYNKLREFVELHTHHQGLQELDLGHLSYL